MLKNDGFYMAELMLSLAGWLLIAGFIVPYILQVKKQTIQVYEQEEAFHLLYESIQTVLIEHPERINNTVVKGGILYEVMWQEGGKEVCVTYEDVLQKKNQLCREVP
ncbi:hypothetical protein [Bacillus benzoevorans]|uniref:Competence protein ComGE n=1 Tax=Bacillus benzoevorans TaxID=1456 RepID=A0A7X0HQ76_9BACI|nr:hypothetical protein [Bacillus benzoevorans]MBB6444904.1 hypothetical protein [Bacillus benzoevorans]